MRIIQCSLSMFHLTRYSAGDQDAEKKKAEEEIQGLKRSILERDLKICKFVDVTLDEAK